jgi:ABC-type transporter MlaC component
MKAKIIIALAVFTSSAFAASAQTADPATTAATTTARPVSTLKHDRARVRQGVKSGELTKKETGKLAVQGAKVRQERKDVKADGTVTPDERKNLRQDKKKLSKNIYKQKHDAQTQP